MFCVFSIGSKELAESLFTALSEHYNTTFFNGEKLAAKGTGKKILLISTKKPISSAQPYIAVFSRNYKGNILTFPENSISIVSSDNKQLLCRLSKTKSRVVTCGMCAKDTITCTSIIENRAVIATQRCLTDISGKCHMPSESPFIIRDNADIYDQMAACALLTILGVNI